MPRRRHGSFNRLSKAGWAHPCSKTRLFKPLAWPFRPPRTKAPKAQKTRPRARAPPHPKGAAEGALHTRLDVDTAGLFLSYSHASPHASDATFNLKDLRWARGVGGGLGRR